MAGSNGAFTGRDVIIEISFDQDPTVVPNDFVRLGAVRNKEWGPQWDIVDATADDSPGFNRQRLATFVNTDMSFSGITQQDETKNHDLVEDYVNDPANGQPCGWVRITRPSGFQGSTSKVQAVPVLFSSYRQTGSYEDVVTWALDASSTGEIDTQYI